MVKPPAETDPSEPSPDLPSDAKSRIRLEEAYRAEVRGQLDRGEQSRGGKIVKFFNSALGLWLLSTLVVSVLGAAYTRYQENVDRERVLAQEARHRARAREDEIRRLDLEISFRLSGLMSYLQHRHQAQTGPAGIEGDPAPVSIEELELAIRLPPREAPNYRHPAYSLYQSNRAQPLPSLLAQLSWLLGQDAPANESDESQSIDGSLSRISAIPVFFERKRLARGDNAQRIASAFQEEVFLPRWRRNSFAFTDCSMQTPFC